MWLDVGHRAQGEVGCRFLGVGCGWMLVIKHKQLLLALSLTNTRLGEGLDVDF